jgi:hypothetical protein
VLCAATLRLALAVVVIHPSIEQQTKPMMKQAGGHHAPLGSHHPDHHRGQEKKSVS